MFENSFFNIYHDEKVTTIWGVFPGAESGIV